jgi:hypothetical protein
MNKQVERANGMTLQGLKPRIFSRLNKFDRQWVAELPAVLWSLRTTSSRATGFMPFFMVYGSEAILPTDWSMERQELERTMTKRSKPPLRTPWTSWRKYVMSPYSTPPSTSKLYVGTTIAMCGVRRSTLGT